MATILAFPAHQASGGGAGRTAPLQQASASAELIFFPGVRYERAISKPALGSRRSRRVKEHELIDLTD